MKIKRIFIFIVNVFLCVNFFALEVSIPKSTSQGDFITVYFTGREKLKHTEVKLIDPNGKLHYKIAAFSVDDTGKKQIALLGIPTWAIVGDWTVEISTMEGKRYREKTQSLKIAKTAFNEYTLYLDARNTGIVTKPDPKKKEEARILTEILTHINMEAKPFSKTFIVPTTSTRITSPFGEKRKLVYNTGKTGSEVHWGVDFGIPVGSKLVAPADGTVVFAGDRIVSGGTIIIEHAPGVYTLFYHLSETLKAVGETVTAGEVVALSGNTGFSTGPHLHWEMRMNTVPISPFSVVKKPLYKEW